MTETMWDLVLWVVVMVILAVCFAWIKANYDHTTNVMNDTEE